LCTRIFAMLHSLDLVQYVPLFTGNQIRDLVLFDPGLSRGEVKQMLFLYSPSNTYVYVSVSLSRVLLAVEHICVC
jgi:hypothetical protein